MQAGLAEALELCPACLDFERHERSFRTRYSEAVVSAEKGCTLCKWIATALYRQTYCELVVPDMPVEVGRMEDRRVEIREVDDAKSYEDLIRLEMYTPAASSPLWEGLGRAADVLFDPGSDEAIRTIKKWLQGCLDSHGECQEPGQPTLPTRVLDLEPVEPLVWKTNGAKGTYIALSHCWGMEKGLTATWSGMPMLKQKINVSALMKTFRDAIFVARELGVRYLWVDSLCIIQDSPEDWMRELANMRDVYRNSFLTIVVAGSASDAQGFLGPRQHVPTVQNGTSESNKRVSSRRHPHSGPLEPLYTRAWTFQERFLSPRMIKFKRQELEWHCRASKICECGHYGDHRSFIDYTRQFGFAYRGLSGGTTEEVHMIWRHSIVQGYSGLSLTKPSDRLPALSGLASLARERIPDANYLAGLWESDLIQGLQWYCESEAARVPFGAHFGRAQQRWLSWSWVSVPGPVAYPLPQRNFSNVTRLVNSSIRILHTESVLMGSDPHGEVERGVLVIRAPTTRAQKYEICSQDGKMLYYAFRIDAPSPTIIRCSTGNSAELNLFYPDDQVGYRSARYPTRTEQEQLDVILPARFHILPLEIEKDASDEATSCRCLVLEEQTTSGSHVVVKRIGYLVCSPDHIWPNTTEPLEFSIV